MSDGAGVGFSMDFGNWEAFNRNVSTALSEFKWQKWMIRAADVAYKEARRLCPVDTGKMLANLTVEKGVDFFILEDLVFYTSFNEYGWLNFMYGGDERNPKFYKGGYRPFMRPGVLAGQDYFNSKVNNWVKLYLQSGIAR